MTAQAGWVTISCSASGSHAVTTTASLGGKAYTIDPTVDFAYAETCTVTIHKEKIQDMDGTLSLMAVDKVWSLDITPFIVYIPVMIK